MPDASGMGGAGAGRRLFYRSVDTVMVVDVSTRTGLEVFAGGTRELNVVLNFLH